MAEGYEPKPPEGFTLWNSGNVNVEKVGRFAFIGFGNVSFNSDGVTVNVTLPDELKPMHNTNVYSKCWDGSSYVDCQLLIWADGKIRFATLSGGAISGLQTSFFQTKPITYMTAQ